LITPFEQANVEAESTQGASRLTLLNAISWRSRMFFWQSLPYDSYLQKKWGLERPDHEERMGYSHTSTDDRL
jgi:hypothetical protein